VRHCLFHGITGGDVLTGLLSATQGEKRRRRQPIGQDSEGLPARMTDSTSHPNAFVPVIVGLARPPSMADDRRALTYGTAARQQFQRNHPGSLLSFGSASAIKRIMAGVNAPPLTVCANRSIRWPGLHPPVKTTPNEKRILLPNIRCQTCSLEHWLVIVGIIGK
jgi:hypothetical protein